MNMCDLYKEYLESGETDLEYFDWLHNQILLRSRDRKLEEANKKIKEMNQRTEETNKKIKEMNQKTEEANKKYENLINEINEMIDETKESIIKYSQLKFHEDISISINTLSKNQIFDLLDHLYDFKEFE